MVFEGKREDFDNFKFQCRAVFFEIGAIDVVDKPAEFSQLYESIRVSYLRLGPIADAVRVPDNALVIREFEKMEQKRNSVVRILHSRISKAVSEQMRHVLPEADHFNPIKVWEYLVNTYEISPYTRRVTENLELQVLSLFRLQRDRKRPLSAFIRHVLPRLTKALSNAKLAPTEGGKRLLVGTTLRLILDSIGDEEQRYIALRAKYLTLIVDRTDALISIEEDYLKQFLLEVDIVEAATKVASEAVQHHHGGGSRGNGGGNGGNGGNAGGKSGAHGSHGGGAGGAGKPTGGHGGGSGGQKQSGGKPQHQPKGGAGGGKAYVAGVDVGGGDVGADGQPVKIDCYLGAVCLTTLTTTHSDAAHTGTAGSQNKLFLVDSGATHHCVREKGLFTEFRPGKHVVKVANNKVITGTGKGVVRVQVLAEGGQPTEVTLNDVFFVPSLNNNIFSTNRFTGASAGHSVELTNTGKRLRVDNTTIPLHGEHDLVWLIASAKGKQPPTVVANVPAPAVAAPHELSLQLFHERMGHVNFDDCLKLAAQQGITLTHTKDVMCDVCQTSKQRKQPITDLAVRKPVKPGEVLHCDIKGPLDTAYNRAKYALVVVDEATRVCAAKEMKSKDQTVDALKNIINTLTQLPGGAKIVVGKGSTLHSDSEAVLTSAHMVEFLGERQITARASPPHTHERNGIVERAIQTVFDMTRSLLLMGQLDNKFWPLAMHHAITLRNRVPTQALGGGVPLEQLVSATVLPSLNKLHKFGCKVFIKVDDAGRSALDPKARPGIYVGVSSLSDTHRVLVRSSNNRWDVVNTIHCTFDENMVGSINLPGAAGVVPSDDVHVGGPASTQDAPVHQPAAATTIATTEHKENDNAPLLGGRDPLLDDFDEGAFINALFMGNDSAAPHTYRAAMRCAEAPQWTTAVDSELGSLLDNGTFEAVTQEQAKGRKVLSTSWVFAKKPGADGGIRYKARLVARGDHQRAGIDYNEVYAPVVNATTVRAMMAVAAVNDYELDQMDAVTAFLNAPLEEELYLRVPEGYPEQPAGTVLRLRKSLYGLKQAPRYWSETLNDWLVANGLQQSQVDPCMYFIKDKLWVAFWVDDFLVMSSEVAVMNKFKADISAQFKMRDLGPVQQFLGMTVTRDRKNRTLTLTSTKHIDDVLGRFNMIDAKPHTTPLPPKCVLRECTDNNELLPADVPYRGLVGSLLYIAMWTRPDIAFAVSQVARFQQKPSNNHWLMAKHILRYLKGTCHVGLVFSGNNGLAPTLRGYVDASWGEDLDTRKSQTGYVFTLGNAAVSWKSKLQHTVALSSTEAEYLALSAAVREALFLRNLLGDLHPAAAGTITLFEDNQSTIKQAYNLQSSDRTKHVDIRHHFIKQHVAKGDVALEYIPTAEQLADALTKSLDRVKVSYFRQFTLGSATEVV